MNNITTRKMPFAAACRPPTIGDPRWYVEIPGVNDCFSSGGSIDEAMINIAEALVSRSQQNPLTINEQHQMDNMGYMWSPGYQGFTFKMSTAEVVVVVL